MFQETSYSNLKWNNFPRLPVDNSLLTKDTVLTWTLSLACSCKPSLHDHFTWSLPTAWGLGSHDNYWGLWDLWLRSWLGSRTRKSDSEGWDKGQWLQNWWGIVRAPRPASASRRETCPTTLAEICQAGKQQPHFQLREGQCRGSQDT